MPPQRAKPRAPRPGSKRSHNNRIAHSLNKPRLLVHLFLHDVRMPPPGIVGQPPVLVRAELLRIQGWQPELALQSISPPPT
jgi:hypothetical protein